MGIRPGNIAGGLQPGNLAGAAFSGPSNRSFTLSAAVSGKTFWNLDVDGPCTISGQTLSMFPNPGLYCVVEVRGPGGSTGGIGLTTGTSPSNASASFFSGTGITTMTANNGARSLGRTTNAAGTGGAGGTATGGDTNTSGATGGNATVSSPCVGGDGGANGNGGGTVTGPTAADGVTVQGTAGNVPGGGASGSASGSATAANRRAAGGAGGGAYCKTTYAVGALLPGLAYVCAARASTAAGTGDLANGAQGANGTIVIT